ncbi:hypothetical protein [Actinomyces bowdenii]|uniref:hypothetical protein n=1 Tax=Actinomyces bowdenii TaxID=131109 RepID=UPI00163A32AE|nr:hypothetical protein [Actinomyces bowdenii]
MSNDFWLGIAGILGGGLIMVNWWFEMFSDSAYAQLCRSIMESHSLGRNTIAIIEPAMGAVVLHCGLILLTDKKNPLMQILVPSFFVFLVIAILGLVPLRLPGPMYPEWQMEKRRRRRAQAHGQELETTPTNSSSSHLPDHTDPPAPRDSLPPRAHHQDSSPPGQENQPPTTTSHRSAQ